MQDTVRVTLSEALRHAYAAYKAGKFDVAERLCLQVIDANGSLFSAQHLLGIVQSARGEKLLALASFDRAIALRPDYVEALTNRGNTLHELERFEEALTNYERALTVRPDSVMVLYNRGNTLHALGRFDEALAVMTARWRCSRTIPRRFPIAVPRFVCEALRGGAGKLRPRARRAAEPCRIAGQSRQYAF